MRTTSQGSCLDEITATVVITRKIHEVYFHTVHCIIITGSEWFQIVFYIVQCYNENTEKKKTRKRRRKGFMNEECRIRVANPEDAEELLKIYAPYVENTAITFEYEVPSQEEFARRIWQISGKYPYLVLEEGNEILGYAYAGAFKERAAYDWAVETTIYIRQDQKKRGMGKRLYQALENCLKKQNITNLNACIGVPETEDAHLDRNSMEFHGHLGYRLVGEFRQCGYKFDTWYHMVWMEKIIGEHRKQQPAMIPFPRVLEMMEKPWEE